VSCEVTNGNGTPDLDPLLVDAAELARLLACSRRHIERLDSAGKLPKSVRIGHAKRWPLNLTKKWIAAGCPDRRTFEAMVEMETKR